MAPEVLVPSTVERAEPPGTGHAPAVGPVLAAVRARIELGDLLPGEQLRQDDLADALGVSRAPVREALRVLESDGVVEHRPHRGYFVARRTAEELRQVYRMLELLEGELCRRLVWPDEAGLAHLRACHEDLGAVVDLPDPAPAVALNRRFHEALFACSPDGLVQAEVARLWALAGPAIALHLVEPADRARTVAQHEAIVDAVADRRRLALLRAVEAHRADEARALDASLLPASLARPGAR